MLDKLSKGWFRLYGTLQHRAYAHGGELLYEVDLGDGASVMWASSARNPYSVSLLLGKLAVHGTHTACLCYWVFISFVTKIDTACLCYSVFCDLDVKNRSCIARKEKFLFWWSFLGQSRQKPQNSDPKDLSHLHVMFSIMCLPLWHCYVTIQILCQVWNLWSGTYTWCSVSCACHCPLLLASCLTQFSSRKPLDTSHSVRY